MTEEHHSTEQQLIENRIEKMARFRERGDEPFKYIFILSSDAAEASYAYTICCQPEEGIDELPRDAW